VTPDDFWALIDRSSAATATRERRTTWLSEQVTRLPAADIVDFEVHLTTQRKRVDTWVMWGVGSYLMQGLCSTDGFFYFQPWLVGLGRDMFERVVADPDALAEVPDVQRLAGRSVKEWQDDEWPEWESLNYVAIEAYETVTGEDGLEEALEARGVERVFDPEPDGDEWNHESAEERQVRIPRLAALLG
jgi:hypothetical protein